MARDRPSAAARFAVAALATWRVTHLLAHEDGPGAVVARVRGGLGTGWVGELADCFQCLSLWVAAPVTLSLTVRCGEAVVTWFALSGAACLLEERFGSVINYHEEDEDGVLWTTADGSGGPSTNGE